MKIDLPKVGFTSLKLKASNLYSDIICIENHVWKSQDAAFKRLFLKFVSLPKSEKLYVKVDGTIDKDKIFTFYTNKVNKKNLDYHKYLTIRPCYFQAPQNVAQIESNRSISIIYDTLSDTIKVSMAHSDIATLELYNDIISSFEIPGYAAQAIDYYYNNNGINPPLISIPELIARLDSNYYSSSSPGYLLKTYYQVSNKTESDLVFSTIAYYKIRTYAGPARSVTLLSSFYSLLPFIASEMLSYINLNKDFGDVTNGFAESIKSKLLELITNLVVSLYSGLVEYYYIDVSENYLYSYIRVTLIYDMAIGDYANFDIKQDIFYHIEDL